VAVAKGRCQKEGARKGWERVSRYMRGRGGERGAAEGRRAVAVAKGRRWQKRSGGAVCSPVPITPSLFAVAVRWWDWPTSPSLAYICMMQPTGLLSCHGIARLL
jgi:hypothetical protein